MATTRSSHEPHHLSGQIAPARARPQRGSAGLGRSRRARPGGDAGVERLQCASPSGSRPAGRRSRHQPREALALRADHDHERSRRQVEVGQRHVAVGGETGHHQTGVLVGLELPHQVGRLRDRHPGRGAGRGLPGARGHARGAPLRDHAPRGRRTRPRIARPRRGCAGRSRSRAPRSAAAPRPRPHGRGGQRVGVLVRRAPAPPAPGARPRRSSCRARCAVTSSMQIPRSAAILNASRSRSSRSVRSATYSVVTGMFGAQRLDHRVAAGHPLGVARCDCFVGRGALAALLLRALRL